MTNQQLIAIPKTLDAQNVNGLFWTDYKSESLVKKARKQKLPSSFFFYLMNTFAYWLADFLKAKFKQIHLLSSLWKFGLKQSIYLTLTFPNWTECVPGQALLN